MQELWKMAQSRPKHIRKRAGARQRNYRAATRGRAMERADEHMLFTEHKGEASIDDLTFGTTVRTVSMFESMMRPEEAQRDEIMCDLSQ